MNDTVLKALSTALLTHKNVNDQYRNWPPENRLPFEQAAAIIEELQSSNPIPGEAHPAGAE